LEEKKFISKFINISDSLFYKKKIIKQLNLKVHSFFQFKKSIYEILDIIQIENKNKGFKNKLYFKLKEYKKLFIDKSTYSLVISKNEIKNLQAVFDFNELEICHYINPENYVGEKNSLIACGAFITEFLTNPIKFFDIKEKILVNDSYCIKNKECIEKIKDMIKKYKI
jgi:hypothetical protein